MNDISDLLAARYVLGTTEVDEATKAELRLKTDGEFAERVAVWSERLTGLEDSTSEIQPSSTLWNRIEAGIDQLQASPTTHTVRTGTLVWEEIFPGVERKVLFLDPELGIQNILIRMAPGSDIGTHAHSINEECLVLEGEIEVDGVTVKPGELHLAWARQSHSTVRSPKGALLYIRSSLDAAA